MTQPYPSQAARLDIGQVLARVISLLRRGFVAAWLAESGLCAILGVLNMALTVALAGTRAFSRPSDNSGFGVLIALVALVFLLLQYAAAISLMTKAAVADPDGPPPGVRALAAAALPQVIPVTVVLTGYVLAVIVGYVFLVFPAIFISLVFAVVAQARAAEPISWLQAFSRSAALTENNRWTIFLLRIVWGVANGVGVALMFIGIGTFGALFGAQGTQALGPVALALILLILPLSVVVTAALLLFNAALPAALYAELRRLKEGDRASSIEQVFS